MPRPSSGMDTEIPIESELWQTSPDGFNFPKAHTVPSSGVTAEIPENGVAGDKQCRPPAMLVWDVGIS